MADNPLDAAALADLATEIEGHPDNVVPALLGDRKSTRLNSSHTVISYAVFCLKKKKKNAHHLILA